jgi:hypothetical protein
MVSTHLPGTVGLLVCSLQVSRRRPGLEEIWRVGRQAEEYDEGRRRRRHHYSIDAEVLYLCCTVTDRGTVGVVVAVVVVEMIAVMAMVVVMVKTMTWTTTTAI